jgi:hypothetical protein
MFLACPDDERYASVRLLGLASLNRTRNAPTSPRDSRESDRAREMVAWNHGCREGGEEAGSKKVRAARVSARGKVGPKRARYRW